MATYKAEFLAHHYAGRVRPGRALLDGLAARWPRCSPRPAPGVVNAAGRLPGLGRADQARRRHRRAARAAAVRPAAFTRWYSPAAARRRTGRASAVLLWPDTFTNTSTPRSGRRRSPCSRTPDSQVELPGQAALLRADLDLHRPAGRGPAGAAAAPIDALRPAPAGGLAGGRCSSRAAPRCSGPTRPSSSRRPTTPGCWPGRPGPSPSCWPSHGWQPAGSPPRLHRARRGPSRRCTATSTPIMGFDRRPGAAARLRGGRGRARQRLLRAGRQLRLRARPLRGLGGVRRARPAGRRCGTPTRAPRSWPTGSPAAPRSRPATCGREGIHLAQLLAGMLGDGQQAHGAHERNGGRS